MFTDKETEASEKIMRDVNMLLQCVNSPRMVELRERSVVRKPNGDLTDDATAARTKYVQECAKSFETFYYRYTSLFYMILDEPDGFSSDSSGNDGPNMQKLKRFIGLKDRVEITKDVTHKEVSEQLGKEAFDKYVQPLVNTLDSSK